jgi:flagellar basal-body rod modification protein FlgD
MTTSIPPVGSPTTTAPTTQSPNAFDKDMFLKLLVAQLRYQNPLEPTDPSTFLSQSAQFTVVEKLDELTKLIGAGSSIDLVAMSSSLVGRTISFEVDGKTGEGVVEAVVFDEGLPVLRLADGKEVPLAAVREVRAS